jgi:hypothetical protein
MSNSERIRLIGSGAGGSGSPICEEEPGRVGIAKQDLFPLFDLPRSNKRSQILIVGFRPDQVDHIIRPEKDVSQKLVLLARFVRVCASGQSWNTVGSSPAYSRRVNGLA